MTRRQFVKNAATTGIAAALNAAPTVSDVTIAFDEGSRMMTIGYSLSEDAVVTVDILTNNVSIGAEKFADVAAYCNGLDCLTAADAVDANLNKIGWYKRNDWSIHPVGQKEPNSWGLYDMCGSIWEWCRDWVGTGSVTPYGTEDVTDPPGLAAGTVRSRRGGSFDNVPWAARCAFRTCNTPDTANGSIAFRLYLPVSEVVGK